MSRVCQATEVEPGFLDQRKRSGEEFWHVLHVKSRQEKILSGMLEGMGIDCYVPLHREVTYHGQRKVLVERPLFPGYAFLWGSVDDAFAADRTSRVANLIRVEEQDRLEWELRNVDRALCGDAPLVPCPRLREGTRVIVLSGPFRGLEGLVNRRTRDARLVLQVEMLGSAMSLEIEESLLMTLD